MVLFTYTGTAPTSSEKASMTELFVSASVSQIPIRCFQDCTLLNTVTFETGSFMWYIGVDAFSGCTSLPSIQLPSEVTFIAQRAFKDCSALTSVTFTSGVTDIKSDAFYNCGILEITLPSRVSTLDSRAFQNCSDLVSVDFQDSSIRTLDYDLFNGCTSLVNLNLPKFLETIKPRALKNCTSLTQINFPSTMSSIEQWGFDSCTQLSEVTFNSLVTVVSTSFVNCDQLLTFTFSASDIKNSYQNSYSTFYAANTTYRLAADSANICFIGSTLVDTDQGSVRIDELKPGYHTFNRQKLLGVSETICSDTEIVQILPHALGENYPSQKTVMSRLHHLLWKGKVYRAEQLLTEEGVTLIPSGHQVLYNVLLDTHRLIDVQGMKVETLSPRNYIAQKILSKTHSYYHLQRLKKNNPRLIVA